MQLNYPFFLELYAKDATVGLVTTKNGQVQTILYYLNQPPVLFGPGLVIPSAVFLRILWEWWECIYFCSSMCTKAPISPRNKRRGQALIRHTWQLMPFWAVASHDNYMIVEGPFLMIVMKYYFQLQKHSTFLKCNSTIVLQSYVALCHHIHLWSYFCMFSLEVFKFFKPYVSPLCKMKFYSNWICQ